MLKLECSRHPPDKDLEIELQAVDDVSRIDTMTPTGNLPAAQSPSSQDLESNSAATPPCSAESRMTLSADTSPQQTLASLIPPDCDFYYNSTSFSPLVYAGITCVLYSQVGELLSLTPSTSKGPVLPLSTGLLAANFTLCLLLALALSRPLDNLKKRKEAHWWVVQHFFFLLITQLSMLTRLSFYSLPVLPFLYVVVSFSRT